MKEIYDNIVVTMYHNTAGHLLHGDFKDCDIVINVSDQHYPQDMIDQLVENKKEFYWFPLGEHIPDMGLSSLYGALKVVHRAFNSGKKILVHCHAGLNRSQLVRACFYYMMTGTHIDHNRIRLDRHPLLNNCYWGNLPALPKMELWLREMKKDFERGFEYSQYDNLYKLLQ